MPAKTTADEVKAVLGTPDADKMPTQAGSVIATLTGWSGGGPLADYGITSGIEATPGPNLAVSFQVGAGQSYGMEIYRGTDVNDANAKVWTETTRTATEAGFKLIYVCLEDKVYSNPNSGSGFLVGNNLPSGVYSYVTIVNGVKSTPVTFEFTAS